MGSYFKVMNVEDHQKQIPFENKAMQINILKNYFKQPKSLPKKRHTFSHSNRPDFLNGLISTSNPKQSDIRYIDTITSNDFKSNNLGNKIFSPDFRMMKQTANFTGKDNSQNFDIRRTVPSKRNISNFDPITSLHYQNKLSEYLPSEIRTGTETGDYKLMEVTSGPEVRVDLNSDHPQKIYQFENKFVKNVSSLKNSSLLMKVNKPMAVKTQNNFRKTPFKLNSKRQNGMPSQSNEQFFSQTTPGGFTLGKRDPASTSIKMSQDPLNRSSSRFRRGREMKSTSRDPSRPRNATVSSYEQNALSREKQSSLPKSVRFVDSLLGSQKRNKSINLKSILRNASPKNQIGRNISLKQKPLRNSMMRSSGQFSNSPRIKKYTARGSASRKKLNEIGRKILQLNQNISRISEQNESSRMTESKSSQIKNSSRFQTIIPGNVIQKVTGTPLRSGSKGKVVVLNDSRLSNSFKKISGNALISNSVKRIRQERLSRRIPQKSQQMQTPTSMLTNSGNVTKRSHFASSVNKENRNRELKQLGNPFRNTIVSPKKASYKQYNPSFRVVNDQSKNVRTNLFKPSSINPVSYTHLTLPTICSV